LDPAEIKENSDFLETPHHSAVDLKSNDILVAWGQERTADSSLATTRQDLDRNRIEATALAAATETEQATDFITLDEYCT